MIRRCNPGSDLFASPAHTLVNPVNTTGVIGAGLARAFRDRYPEMFCQYQELCRRGRSAGSSPARSSPCSRVERTLR
jgi:hypothetical protein